MIEFSGYDHMMTEYYENMSNHALPLMSWEFFGEYHAALENFKEDFTILKRITKNWSFNRDYYKEFIDKKSVIVITSSKLKIVYASRNIERLNGYSPEEVIGNSPKMFQGQDTCLHTTSKVREAINKGAPFEVSILNYKKDQTPYMCLIKGFPVYNKSGKLVNYIAFEKAA